MASFDKNLPDSATPVHEQHTRHKMTANTTITDSTRRPKRKATDLTATSDSDSSQCEPSPKAPCIRHHTERDVPVADSAAATAHEEAVRTELAKGNARARFDSLLRKFDRKLKSVKAFLEKEGLSFEIDTGARDAIEAMAYSHRNRISVLGMERWMLGPESFEQHRPRRPNGKPFPKSSPEYKDASRAWFAATYARIDADIEREEAAHESLTDADFVEPYLRAKEALKFKGTFTISF